jgi:hypothetical protein
LERRLVEPQREKLSLSLKNDGPDLSSERAPHMDRTVTFKEE